MVVFSVNFFNKKKNKQTKTGLFSIASLVHFHITVNNNFDFKIQFQKQPFMGQRLSLLTLLIPQLL